MPSQLCNLASRNAVNYTLCLGCKAVNEDSVHALWSCKSRFTIWEHDEVVKQLLKYHFNSYLWEMFLRMRERLNINLVATLFLVYLESKKLSGNRGGCAGDSKDLSKSNGFSSRVLESSRAHWAPL